MILIILCRFFFFLPELAKSFTTEQPTHFSAGTHKYFFFALNTNIL